MAHSGVSDRVVDTRGGHVAHAVVVEVADRYVLHTADGAVVAGNGGSVHERPVPPAPMQLNAGQAGSHGKVEVAVAVIVEGFEGVLPVARWAGGEAEY